MRATTHLGDKLQICLPHPSTLTIYSIQVFATNLLIERRVKQIAPCLPDFCLSGVVSVLYAPRVFSILISYGITAD